MNIYDTTRRVPRFTRFYFFYSVFFSKRLTVFYSNHRRKNRCELHVTTLHFIGGNFDNFCAIVRGIPENLCKIGRHKAAQGARNAAQGRTGGAE